MPIDIRMPALSPTMEKGTLSKWLKKKGDTVKSGDVIAEIETDKATMEYEAVDEGVIAEIVVPEGTADVAVNTVIAVLAADGEDAKKPSDAPKPATAKPEAKADTKPAPAPAKLAATPSPAAAKKPEPAQHNGGNRVFASPLARRIAKDKGIDVASVQGSGPHGRVIARDIENAKPGTAARPAAGAPAAGHAPLMTDAQIRSLFEDGSYEVVPHDGMRRTIAERLSAAAREVPHFYLTIDCEVDKLLAAREQINAGAPKGKDGKPAYKLSVNDFVVKAMALALQRIPDCNVSWTEGGMLKHKHSDVGVAVAMPGGLITPIVRQAETKTLSAISTEMRDYAARARDRKLKPHEYQGGTTAVSNLGMYGIKHFTAIINPPHTTILAVGASEQCPVVRDGQFAVATIMSVTLACDHRAIDGALGAELIGAFKALIENPVTMVV